MGVLELKHNFLSLIEVFSRSVNTSKAISEPCLVVLVNPRINHVLVRDIDIPCSLLKIHRAYIGVRGIQNTLFVFKIPLLAFLDQALLLGLVLGLSLLDRLLNLDGARIFHLLDVEDLVIPEAVHMNFLVLV